jgi:hypothetical protein
MSGRVRRWVLLLLALSAADTGVWATLAPRSWYDAFPGAGHHWVAVLGPYNEHLSRDVGGLYLALLVLSAGAAVRPADGYLVRLTAAAWLAFSIPHLIYHLGHLDMLEGTDKVLSVIGLGAVVIAGGALLLPYRRVPDVTSAAGGTSPAADPHSAARRDEETVI